MKIITYERIGILSSVGLIVFLALPFFVANYTHIDVEPYIGWIFLFLILLAVISTRALILAKEGGLPHKGFITFNIVYAVILTSFFLLTSGLSCGWGGDASTMCITSKWISRTLLFLALFVLLRSVRISRREDNSIYFDKKAALSITILIIMLAGLVIYVIAN